MIVVTGGHLTPALAFIDALPANLRSQVIFIGRHFAAESSRTSAHEQRLIADRGLQFLPLTTGKLPRHFNLHQLVSLAKFPLGLTQALLYLRRYRPRLVVSFGGYIALPVALAAAMLKIPVITHEQGTRPGLANKLIARLAKTIAVSWATNLPDFPALKTVLTGNPLRSAILEPSSDCPFTFKPAASDKIIYVTGGNQGAQVINSSLLPLLPQLLDTALVIHQTGLADFNQCNQAAAVLPPRFRQRYFPAPWLEDSQVSWCLRHAHLLVGRSGANTVTEVAFTGLPALFIPLPWAQQNEQFFNAQLLQDAGLARILLQKDLSPQSLSQAIAAMLKNESAFRRHAPSARKLLQLNAAQNLVHLIHDFI